MKRIFEWIGGFALIAFSFYFTDQVSLLVANKSVLMEEIKSVSKNYEVDAVDAVVDDKNNTIVPGKYGKVVDNNESYLSMHEFGVFNENFLVYKKVKPTKSLEDNKDKFITSGNASKREVSFILESENEISEYFDTEKIPYDIIATSKVDLKSGVEYINAATNKDDFKSINKEVASKICINSYSDIELCKKYDYYIVDVGLNLNSSNYLKIKGQISPGVMVLINNNAKLDDVKFIINEIKYKDLKPVYVSKLISEETD